MKIIGRKKEQSAKEDNSNNEWEWIGSQGIGGKNTGKVPNWVLKAYKKFDAHADGLVHRFDGKGYQYKVEERGPGGIEHIFYRRLKPNRVSQSQEKPQSESESV
jgi:hypothetical protein